MESSSLLTIAATAFAGLALLLLTVPPLLVAKRKQPWRGVVGLWVAGWGFLLIAAGAGFAHRGWGNLAVAGIVLSGVGHVVQSRNTRKTAP